MRQTIVIVWACAVLFCIGTRDARSQEEAVPANKIPKAVMDALLAKFPKAKIDKCTKAKEGGDLVYDIEFKQERRKCEADIKENGAYINYEWAIEAKELPKPVRQAIDKKYPNASLKEVMEETEVKGKDEKLSAYEVVLVTTDKTEGRSECRPKVRSSKTPGRRSRMKRSNSVCVTSLLSTKPL